MAITPPLWETDPIQFLIQQKYPALVQFADPELRRSRPILEARYREAEHLANVYFFELSGMGVDHFQELLKQEKDKLIAQSIENTKILDGQRFFSESFANVELDYWSKISYWTTDEAAALSLEKDPRVVTWNAIEGYAGQSFFVYAFAERRELIRRAVEAGQLMERNTPAFFLAWALRTRFYMPIPLIEAVSSLGTQIADWKTEYDRLVAFVNDQSQQTEATRADLEKQREDAFDALFSLNNEYIDLAQKYEVAEQELLACREGQSVSLPPEKALHARERDSLLKLIIGMAIKGYGHDPKAARGPTAKEIAGDLALQGIPLDEDTVRKYLAEARELLPPDETEQNR